jgi:hypothetical protein
MFVFDLGEEAGFVEDSFAVLGFFLLRVLPD